MLSESNLRPYQHIMIDHMINTPKCAAWAGMGLGKTVSTFTAIDRMMLAGILEKPTLVIAPLRVARDVWPDEVREWSHLQHLKVQPVLGSQTERIAALQTKADVYTINFENLEWLIGLLWDRWPFDMIVVDECFRAGTLVDTPRGPVPIESLSVGDTVLSAAGVDRVVRTHSRESSELVEMVVNGKSIWCSTKHPFFTSRGWVCAKDVAEGEVLYGQNDCMRMVREGNAEGLSGEILRQILLSEMADDTTGGKNASLQSDRLGQNSTEAQEFSCERGFWCYRSNRAHSQYQSRSQSFSRDSGQSVAIFESDELETISAWRKRPRTDRRSTASFGCTREWVAERTTGQIEASRVSSRGWVSDVLQNRCSKYEVQCSGRDRRVFTQGRSPATCRREETERAGEYRVDRIAIYKSGSPEFSRLSGGKNTITLYDLQIERHPSYSVHGLLVHNCTKLKSLRASVRKHPKTGTEFVSGKGGQRALALLKVVYQHKPSRFVELSGTPAPNGLQDLWGQVYYLDYGKRLGNVYSAFRNRWFEQDFNGWGVKPKAHAQDEIQGQLKDICLALKSEDWFDLDQPIVRKIHIDLPPDIRKNYREMEKSLLAEISGHKIEAFNAGAMTMKCRQIASGACYTAVETAGKRPWVEVHKLKLDALDEIIEEAAGMPVLVTYDFKSDLERLLKRFPKGKALDQKSSTITDWNAGKVPVMFAHPASAGHGLNLQKGSNILVYFGWDWNHETHSQVLERIGPVRQAQAGLTRNVYVYYIIARNTVDEDMLESHQSKRSIQDILMENLKRRAA